MKIKTLVSAFLVACISFSLSSQNNYKKYRITFTDKNNSPYSIEQPQEFLSKRALDRRERYKIALTKRDLPVTPSYIEQVVDTNVVLINKSKWMNFITVYFKNDSVLSTIENLDFVKNVTHTGYYQEKNKDYIDAHNIQKTYNALEMKESDQCQCAKESEKQLVRHHYDYGSAENQIGLHDGQFMHKQGYAGEGMIIAVLDGGFYHTNMLPVFDSLWAGGQILGFRDFNDPTGDVYIQSCHGMKVLSTMGANYPGVMVGTAPKAKYWLLRTEDAGSEYICEEDSWIAGAEFADSAGADIINSSLGYTDFDDPSMSHSYEDLDGNTTRVTIAADIAASTGMIVINSVGNSGDENWRYLGAPADGDSVLAVGATDGYGNPVSFSSLGPTADGRIKPEVSAQGYFTAIASTIDGVTYGNGTSFSTPIISGLTACLWQAAPHLSNMQVIELIKKYSSQYKQPGYKLGYGIPNFAKAFIEASQYNIPNFENEKNIKIRPNPFKNSFEVVFISNNSKPAHIQIVDMAGRVVYQKNNIMKLPGYNNIEFDSLSIDKGIYVLWFESGDFLTTKKIIKAE